MAIAHGARIGIAHQHPGSGKLRHGFDQQHPGNDGHAGEMPLQNGQIVRPHGAADVVVVRQHGGAPDAKNVATMRQNPLDGGLVKLDGIGVNVGHGISGRARLRRHGQHGRPCAVA